MYTNYNFPPTIAEFHRRFFYKNYFEVLNFDLKIDSIKFWLVIVVPSFNVYINGYKQKELKQTEKQIIYDADASM